MLSTEFLTVYSPAPQWSVYVYSFVQLNKSLFHTGTIFESNLKKGYLQQYDHPHDSFVFIQKNFNRISEQIISMVIKYLWFKLNEWVSLNGHHHNQALRHSNSPWSSCAFFDKREKQMTSICNLWIFPDITDRSHDLWRFESFEQVVKSLICSWLQRYPTV